MATSIRSSALDFNNIKNNLKAYFQGKNEFADYNFEAAGLSNILDVLAYNTHINGLIANFAINEAYLNTAQVRSSVISLAENLGYVPKSVTSARAVVNLTVSDAAAPSTLTLPAYTKFTTEVGGVSYTFQTVKQYTAQKDINSNFVFVDEKNDPNIVLYEGSAQSINFIAVNPTTYPVYYINDTNIDLSTALVRVYPQASSSYTEYTNIFNLSQISATSNFYIIKESPVGGYDLTFGDNITFGAAPNVLDKIQVQYIRASTDPANSASVFTPVSEVSWSGGSSELVVTTISSASGGGPAEPIDSIKLYAPFQFATQNRMVTADDYTSLIRRNFGYTLYDITSWGGEDNVDPEFGAIYVSLNFSDNITTPVQRDIRKQILNLKEQFGVISFRLRFVDPEITYIKLNTEIQYSTILTSNISSVVTTNAQTAIGNYFSTNLDENRFNQTFRRSRLLASVDESVTGVLSSRTDVSLGREYNPNGISISSTITTICDLSAPSSSVRTQIIVAAQAGNFDAATQLIISGGYSSSTYNTIRAALVATTNTATKVLYYPVPLRVADDDEYIITSTSFTYTSPNAAILRNKLGTTDIELVLVSTGQSLGIYGTYDPSLGTVSIYNTFPATSAIRIFATPADQSYVVAKRNQLLSYDNVNSTVTSFGSALTR